MTERTYYVYSYADGGNLDFIGEVEARSPEKVTKKVYKKEVDVRNQWLIEETSPDDLVIIPESAITFGDTSVDI